MNAKRRILLVDDDAAVCTRMKTVLQMAGYEVTTARDGREAIALLAKSEFDIVVVDAMSPAIDGHGVIDMDKLLAETSDAVGH